MLGENQENSGVQSKNLHSPAPKKMNRREKRDSARTNLRPNSCSENRLPLNDVSSTLGNISISGKSSPNHDKPRTIVIEGNIGSGKSTLLKYFGQKDEVEVFPEPVHKWRDNRGENMLELFYKDTSRWSFAFESYAQFTLLQVHKSQPKCRVKMMERSLFSGKYCFIENLIENNKLQTPEYNVLSEWFDWLITTKDLQVDHIVYLRSTPEQCERRILERSRKEEAGIPLDYLKDLHERHEDWLVRRTKFELPAPVMVLDATKPLDEMVHQFKHLEEELGI